MRKLNVQTIFLPFSIILSLFLSYILIFDKNYFISTLRPQHETAQLNIQNDSEFSVSDYYKLANIKLSEVLYPTNIIISQSEKAYLLNDYPTLRSLATYLSQRRVTVSGNIITPTDVEYLDLITQERIEYVFSNLIPYQMVTHFVKNSGEEIEFNFNRILMSAEDKQVYLVNSINHTYMKATYSEDTTFEAFQAIANTVKTKWVEAERYNLSSGNHVYLPVKNMTLSSEVYTLNQVPENNITQSLFGNGRTWRYVLTNQENNESSISFKNANIDMQINTKTLMAKVNYINTSSYEVKTYAERIEQSFNQLRQFEYWTQGIRYGSQSSSTQSVYQRYLNGLPVFVTSNATNYASTRVLFKSGEFSSSVMQVSLPMLYLEAHLHDLSRNYELMSVSELNYLLNLEGLSVEDFTNVVIGYEWQINMEQFQKVTFIPMWFLEKDNTYYSLNQIQKGMLNASEELSSSQPSQTEGEE